MNNPIRNHIWAYTSIDILEERIKFITEMGRISCVVFKELEAASSRYFIAFTIGSKDNIDLGVLRNEQE